MPIRHGGKAAKNANHLSERRLARILLLMANFEKSDRVDAPIDNGKINVHPSMLNIVLHDTSLGDG